MNILLSLYRLKCCVRKNGLTEGGKIFYIKRLESLSSSGFTQFLRSLSSYLTLKRYMS